MTEEDLIIRSEDDAWTLLERIVAGERIPEGTRVRFEGWPSYSLHIEGKDWRQSVPGRIMPPLLEIQKDLFRAYAQVQYGDANLRRLKDEEKEDLEIVVEVRNGSSDYKADLTSLLGRLIDAGVDKMEPTHLVLLALILAVSWGGQSVAKQWLINRAKLRESEIEAELKMSLSEQETERMKVFARAVQAHPDGEEIRTHAEDGANRVLKTLKPTDKIYFGDVELSGYEAQNLTRKQRQSSTDVELDEVFRICANSVRDSESYKLRLQRLTTGEEFNAFALNELPYDQLELIKEAEWSVEKKVHLVVHATRLRGHLQDAQVLSAKPLEMKAER